MEPKIYVKPDATAIVEYLESRKIKKNEKY